MRVLLFVCALTLSVSIDPEKTQNTEHTAVWKVGRPEGASAVCCRELSNDAFKLAREESRPSPLELSHRSLLQVAMPAEDVLKPDTYRCVALKVLFVCLLEQSF